MELPGETALVTGGTAGIGLEVTRLLARAGPKVSSPAATSGEARAPSWATTYTKVPRSRD